MSLLQMKAANLYQGNQRAEVLNLVAGATNASSDVGRLVCKAGKTCECTPKALKKKRTCFCNSGSTCNVKKGGIAYCKTGSTCKCEKGSRCTVYGGAVAFCTSGSKCTVKNDADFADDVRSRQRTSVEWCRFDTLKLIYKIRSDQQDINDFLPIESLPDEEPSVKMDADSSSGTGKKRREDVVPRCKSAEWEGSLLARAECETGSECQCGVGAQCTCQPGSACKCSTDSFCKCLDDQSCEVERPKFVQPSMSSIGPSGFATSDMRKETVWCGAGEMCKTSKGDDGFMKCFAGSNCECGRNAECECFRGSSCLCRAKDGANCKISDGAELREIGSAGETVEDEDEEEQQRRLPARGSPEDMRKRRVIEEDGEEVPGGILRKPGSKRKGKKSVTFAGDQGLDGRFVDDVDFRSYDNTGGRARDRKLAIADDSELPPGDGRRKFLIKTYPPIARGGGDESRPFRQDFSKPESLPTLPDDDEEEVLPVPLGKRDKGKTKDPRPVPPDDEDALATFDTVKDIDNS